MAALVVSCGGSGGGIKVERFSNGKAGEVLLISDAQYMTQVLENQILTSLTQPQPAINQIEPLFDVIQFENKDFSQHFQQHRNIIHFDINPDYAANQFSLETNHWSAPQVYVKIKGNAADSCVALYFLHETEILNALYNNDLERTKLAFSKNVAPETKRLISKKFGITISIPNHYFLAAEEADFLWFRYKTAKNDRFIMIYSVPMDAMTAENLIAARNAMTKKYVPGAVPGAYPIIAEKLGFPIVEPAAVGKREGVEMRGLWECVNDKMGGPFYSFSFVDEANQQIVTVDGFVYAPQETKRDYLREVEAIVKSVR